MSDTSEDTIQSDRDRVGEKEESICRDFVRGICDRKFCKYKHEPEQRPLNFCHDYQNSICPRPHCKFIHCTPEEVDEYKRTGEMSIQILAEATRKSQLPGLPPICNQFKKGVCKRAFCKYRHLTKEQEDAEIMDLIQMNVLRKQQINGEHSASFLAAAHPPFSPHRRNGVDFEEYKEDGPVLAKRRLIQQVEGEAGHAGLDIARHRIGGAFKGYFAGNPPAAVLNRVDASSCSRCQLFEEENSFLHKEIAQLKKQVSDLTATNEFLLDQNANFRVSNKQRTNSVNVQSATMANGNQPQQTPQVIRTVTASVATVPVSLATVSSGNPVSMAGCPTVSIAATPAQILAPSQQILVTTNPTTQLAIANSSTAQLAIAQQNLANNLAAQQAQPQLTSQAQQLALATSTQQLTSQAQQMANALANASQQLSSQTQPLALANTAQTHQQLNQQLTSQAQQLANSQAQQLALANTTQQLNSQAQQLALASTNQQLTSQAQQLALANTPQQLAVANVPQQLALASTNQQLLAQQNLASSQQIELHRNNQMNAINTSQTIAMSNASQPMVSYPIMTQSINHALTH